MQKHLLDISKHLPKSILESPIDPIGLTVRLTENLEGLVLRSIEDLASAPLVSFFPEGNPSRSAIIQLVTVLNNHAVQCELTCPLPKLDRGQNANEFQ